MDLLLFGLWCFVVAAAGGLVGLVLGNLRLPATLVVASGAAAGAGANLAISAIAAGTAAVAHIRAGRINWRLFAWMAPPSVVGAAVGGFLGGSVSEDLLLGLISAVLLYSAFDLARWRPRPRTPQPAGPDGPAPADPPLNIAAAVGSGALIGLLGGVVGLILGSLRMPALLRLVGEVPHRAVGTNVTVGLLVGVAGALAHVPAAPPDLEVVLVGGAASVPGALVGSRLTGRLSEAGLVRAVALVLLVAGAATGIQAVT